MARTARAKNTDTTSPQKDNLPAVKLEALDHAWIDEMIRKRLANYSTVLLVEIDDPVRVAQLTHYLLGSKEYSAARCYSYDPWNGLRPLKPPQGPSTSSSKRKEDAPSPEATGEFMADLELALREMDTALKAQRTVFLLQWLEAPVKEQLVPVLSHAIRSWAFDPDILANGSVVVLITSERERVLDDTTANLLAWTRAPLPGKAERRHIIQYQADCLGVDTKQTLTPLTLVTAGLNLHQVETSLLEAWHLDRRFDPVRLKNLKAELIKRSELVEVEEPDLDVHGQPRGSSGGFDSVGGYSSVKKFVYERFILPFKQSELAEKYGVPLPRGILLFGPPGTGKTLFARALSKEVNLPFIRLRTENLYSKWLGESGRRFSEAIRLAEQMSPALVFVDEIDRFGKRTSGGGDGASQETRRVFSQLLDWLGDEERKSIILGTTNVPEHLDEAFLREGRFDYKIPFLYPGEEARAQIFRIHLGLTGVKPPVPWEIPEAEIEELIEEMARATDGFTGAEIEQICIRARTNAFLRKGEGMNPEDLRRALSSFRIDAAERAGQKQHYLAMAARFTNDAAFLSELESET